MIACNIECVVAVVALYILCGRPIGCFTHVAHSLSVHCSLWPVTWTEKKHRTNQNGINYPQGTSKWSANFQLKRSRLPDVRNLKKLLDIWRTGLLMGDGSSASCSGAECKLGLTIVRPNLLSTADMLGNGQMAAYHVGTRCQHLFLFVIQFTLSRWCFMFCEVVIL